MPQYIQIVQMGFRRISRDFEWFREIYYVNEFGTGYDRDKIGPGQDRTVADENGASQNGQYLEPALNNEFH